MVYSFNSDPPLPASLIGTAVEADVERRRSLDLIRAFMADQPELKKEKPALAEKDRNFKAALINTPSIQEIHQRARTQAKDYDKGVAAAVALTDAAKAEEEMAQQTADIAIAGNREPPRAAPPVKDNAVAPAAAPPVDLSPKRANTMYEALQQMDPFGRAVITSAMGLSPDVIKSAEEDEIERRNRASVLRWRTAMDDPNSPERKAIDSGDIGAITRLGMAAGAIDVAQGVNMLAQQRSDDERRTDYGYDPKTYDQALIPVMSKSQTLSNPEFAALVGEDGVPAIGEDGRVIQFDIQKLLTTPGAVDDIVRSTDLAASEDILGKRDIRPYVMATNLAVMDQITGKLASGIQYDPATGVAAFPEFESAFLGMGGKGDEPTGALKENLDAYLRHQRVALVASGRFSPDSVKNMDDMEVLSIATGKPRMAAVVDGENNIVLGEPKNLVEWQARFAPGAYAAITQQTMPGGGGGLGSTQPAQAGGDIGSVMGERKKAEEQRQRETEKKAAEKQQAIYTNFRDRVRVALAYYSKSTKQADRERYNEILGALDDAGFTDTAQLAEQQAFGIGKLRGLEQKIGVALDEAATKAKRN